MRYNSGGCCISGNESLVCGVSGISAEIQRKDTEGKSWAWWWINIGERSGIDPKDLDVLELAHLEFIPNSFSVDSMRRYEGVGKEIKAHISIADTRTGAIGKLTFESWSISDNSTHFAIYNRSFNSL